jgi:urease subunit beta
MTQRPEHPSDHPGDTQYQRPDPHLERHPSSGPGTPSPPRRAGTGERQAIRRQHGEDAPPSGPMVPGEVLYGDDPVVINDGADVVTIRVENGADRPIQVGSHYHFAEVNPALEFDRKAAWGRRLNVLSGGSMRFEPGAAEDVELIPIRGQRIVAGLRGECGGELDA